MENIGSWSQHTRPYARRRSLRNEDISVVIAHIVEQKFVMHASKRRSRSKHHWCSTVLLQHGSVGLLNVGSPMRRLRPIALSARSRSPRIAQDAHALRSVIAVGYATRPAEMSFRFPALFSRRRLFARHLAGMASRTGGRPRTLEDRRRHGRHNSATSADSP